MKPGETAQTAIWLDGRETPDDRQRFEADAKQYLDEVCEAYRVIRGPLTFTELNVGDDHVPTPPDHIAGPNVRLLVVEAKILSRKPTLSLTSFITELEPKDLQRLRAITRNTHAKQFRGKTLSDAQCDEVIDSIGPEAALDTLRNTPTSEMMH